MLKIASHPNINIIANSTNLNELAVPPQNNKFSLALFCKGHQQWLYPCVAQDDCDRFKEDKLESSPCIPE